MFYLNIIFVNEETLRVEPGNVYKTLILAKVNMRKLILLVMFLLMVGSVMALTYEEKLEKYNIKVFEGDDQIPKVTNFKCYDHDLMSMMKILSFRPDGENLEYAWKTTHEFELEYDDEDEDFCKDNVEKIYVDSYLMVRANMRFYLDSQGWDNWETRQITFDGEVYDNEIFIEKDGDYTLYGWVFDNFIVVVRSRGDKVPRVILDNYLFLFPSGEGFDEPVTVDDDTSLEGTSVVTLKRNGEFVNYEKDMELFELDNEEVQKDFLSLYGDDMVRPYGQLYAAVDMDIDLDKTVGFEANPPTGFDVYLDSLDQWCEDGGVFTPIFIAYTPDANTPDIDELYMPSGMDRYMLSISRIEDDMFVDQHIYLLELEDCDNIWVSDYSVYINDELVQRLDLDKNDPYKFLAEHCISDKPIVMDAVSKESDEVEDEDEDVTDEGPEAEPEQEQVTEEPEQTMTCKPGYTFINGDCIAVGCSSDKDCVFGQYCDSKVHACVKSECIADKECRLDQVCSHGNCQEPKFVLALFSDDGFDKIKTARNDIITKFTKNINLEPSQIKTAVSDCEVEYGDFEDFKNVKDCFYKEFPELRNYYAKTVFMQLSDNELDSGTPGRAMSGWPSKIFAQYVEGTERVPVHEMGHSFGLLDEYCYNPPDNDKCPEGRVCNINPTDPELDGDDPIKPNKDDKYWEEYDKKQENYCLKRFGTVKRVMGNKWDYPNEGRSFMSGGASPGPWDWDIYDKKHLNNHPLLE